MLFTLIGSKFPDSSRWRSPNKTFGRSGKLDLTIDYVKSVDGQNLNLRSTREIKGDDSYGKAGVVTLLAGPLGFLVKGKNMEMDAGTEYTVLPSHANSSYCRVLRE